MVLDTANSLGKSVGPLMKLYVNRNDDNSITKFKETSEKEKHYKDTSKKY